MNEYPAGYWEARAAALENRAILAEMREAKLLKLLEGFRCGECGNVAVRASNISLASENAKLREALKEIANNGVNPRGEWTGFDHVKIAKAALSGEDKND